jgi:hypothetical protein
MVRVVAAVVPVTAWDEKAVVKATEPPVPPPVPLTILIETSLCAVTCVHPAGGADIKNAMTAPDSISDKVKQLVPSLKIFCFDPLPIVTAVPPETFTDKV